MNSACKAMISTIVLSAFGFLSGPALADQTIVDAPGLHVSSGKNGTVVSIPGVHIQAAESGTPSEAIPSFANSNREKTDFSGQNLAGMDFSNAELSGSDF